MSRVRLACALAMGTGFLSLSQEVLFVRLTSFAFYSTPEAFVFVLVCFLVGIALGAGLGRRICARGMDLIHIGGWVLVAAAVVDALVPRLSAMALQTIYAPILMAVLIVTSAALKSVLFPMLHQLGASSATTTELGRSISRVYASNIAGSTLGPLVTGFWLLEVASLEHAFTLVAAGTLALGTMALAHHRRALALAGVAPAALVVLLWIAPADLLAGIVARDLRPGQSMTSLVERRSGIVHTVSDGPGGPLVFGGNVYDGRISTSLVVNSNGIDRAYLLRLLHPAPARALVIGMSTGAWTEVLARFPELERIDVVEINPAYLELVANHAETQPLLGDPRVSIHIDDGRRWLTRRSTARYDLVVMNTTYHWRAYATNLLSREFLAMVRSHLEPGGIFVFNTTGSPDAAHTATTVFPFVRTFRGAAYCADHDFTVAFQRNGHRIYGLARSGTPALRFDVDRDRLAVEALASVRFVDPSNSARHVDRPVEVVTDDNMITEFRYGRASRLFPALFGSRAATTDANRGRP